METKDMNSKYKKIILVACALLVLLMIVVFVGAAHKSFGGRYFMMTYGRQMMYPLPPQGTSDSFDVPQDAAMKGEIAITVDNLDGAKKNIAGIAEKNNGTIYQSYISYQSNDIRNGSVVVQVPAASFESVFNTLKTIGTGVIEESTQQIPTRNIAPQPQPLPVVQSTEDQASSDASSKNASAPEATVSSAVPTYQQPVQDKGYIKIVFAAVAKQGGYIKNKSEFVNIFNTSGQGLRNNLLVVLAIKVFVLLALLVILIFIFVRMVKDFFKIRAMRKKPTVHIVRQMPKTRARVVRLKKK